jgi:hypothetical protein
MRRRLLVAIVALGLMASCGGASGSSGGTTAASSATAAAHERVLCDMQWAKVPGGRYIVQNNRYGTTAPECIRLTGGTGFEVIQSSIHMPVDGGPGGYPSVYQGCHWGLCGSGGLTATPVRVADLAPGRVTTSWSTIQPSGGAYNAAYDMWFNKKPVTHTQPDCAELMVWLNHTGGVEPFGSRVASEVSVDGGEYDVWEGPQWWGGDTITYLMTTPTTSVTGLDVAAFAQDATHRGYLPESCYLIDIEAGFEIWHSGTGLATTSFSVHG